ncbi:MAG: hypothetical protein ABIP20_05125 [Chthoniobacteraceae bacterium]
MKTISNAIILVLCFTACICRAQQFASVEAAQAAAIKKYPDLSKADSAFNKAFLEKVAERKARLEVVKKSGRASSYIDTNWPMDLAFRVNANLTANAKEALFVLRGSDDSDPKAAKDAMQITITNYGDVRTVLAQLKITYLDGTTKLKTVEFGPGYKEMYRYYAQDKDFRDVEILSANFKLQNTATEPNGQK